MTNSDFPTDQTFHQFHDLYTELDLHRIMSGFHGAFTTGVASQQGTLTLPDTWFRPPFWYLLMLQLLRPNSSNLPCLYSTFHLEYPLVLSRFCFDIKFKLITHRRQYILGWKPLEKNCTRYVGFTYSSTGNRFGSTFDGVYSSYHGGGYSVELDMDIDAAKSQVVKLEEQNWIDRYTRVVVVEATLFNANSRLFSRLKTFFEVSKAGQVSFNQYTDSMRLYPYVEISDYVTLAAQLFFVVIIISKFLLFVYSTSKCSFSVWFAVDLAVQLTKLMLALGYLVFYIWRIDRTIYAIEVLMNNKGRGKYKKTS